MMRGIGMMRGIEMMRGIGVMRGIRVVRMSSVIARIIQTILSCRRGVQGEDRKEWEVKVRTKE